jgi:hypothetical protein
LTRLGDWLEQLSKVKKRQKSRYRVYSSDKVAVKLRQAELKAKTEDFASAHTKGKPRTKVGSGEQ